jgi:hypothetical protein
MQSHEYLITFADDPKRAVRITADELRLEDGFFCVVEGGEISRWVNAAIVREVRTQTTRKATARNKPRAAKSVVQ